ncbi:MAG: hypothetical protein H5U40_10225, partial [Polyangiaceae bacterium]|nr:hypothetical protein [Polyangiaceae bacterium]
DRRIEIEATLEIGRVEVRSGGVAREQEELELALSRKLRGQMHRAPEAGDGCHSALLHATDVPRGVLT